MMSAPTSHMTVRTSPEPRPGSASMKGSLFHLAKFKTLFTLSPQENFPVDSRRIYELIKLLLKKADFFNNWSAWGAGAVCTECPHGRRMACVAGHLGRTRWSRHLCAPVEAVSTPPSARPWWGQPAVTCQKAASVVPVMTETIPERTCGAYNSLRSLNTLQALPCSSAGRGRGLGAGLITSPSFLCLRAEIKGGAHPGKWLQALQV